MPEKICLLHKKNGECIPVTKKIEQIIPHKYVSNRIKISGIKIS